MNGGQDNLFAQEQKQQMKIVDESNAKTNHHYGLEVRAMTDFKDQHLHSGEMQSLKRIAQARRSISIQDFNDTNPAARSPFVNRSTTGLANQTVNNPKSRFGSSPGLHDQTRTLDNFNRSPSPFVPKGSYFGNLAKVPIPVRKELKAATSHGALIKSKEHDMSTISDQDK